MLTLPTGSGVSTVRDLGPVDGPPVVLLHGFPDDASTFDGLATRLAAEGYRALVPTMRGYEPSSRPPDGDHHLMTLAADVVGWIDALGVERAHVIGHDWGAAVASTVAFHHGHRCRSVATLAVPPLPRLPAALRHVPRQLLLSWYMTFFQLPVLPERVLRARNWALLRWFWPRWSPGLVAPDTLVSTFEQPGVLASALAYYRQNATPLRLLGIVGDPATEVRPAGAPVFVLHGDRDGCMDARLFAHALDTADFPFGLRHETVPGAGHFLHLERPGPVADALLEWLAEHERG